MFKYVVCYLKNILDFLLKNQVNTTHLERVKSQPTTGIIKVNPTRTQL